MLSVLQTNPSTKLDRYKEIFDAAYRECPNARCVLSFGCSTGEELVSLSQRWTKAKITGAEILGSVRQTARERYPQFKFTSPDKISGRFDVIIAMSVLCRWPEVGGPLPYELFSTVVRSIDEHLQPGGLFVAWNATYSPASVLEYEILDFMPDLLLDTRLSHRLIVLPRNPDGSLSISPHPVFYRKPLRRGRKRSLKEVRQPHAGIIDASSRIRTPRSSDEMERISRLQRDLARALTRVAALEASTSWKITRPLRFLGTQLRRFRRRRG